MSGQGRDKPGSALVGALVILGLIGVGSLIILLGERAPREPAAAALPRVVPAVPPRPKSAPPALEYAADGVPVKPHVPHDAEPDGPMHPHPITPAHERIYRENNLVHNMGGAMDVKDAAGLRKLLAEYRAEYPEDPHALQEGYAVIADCLDKPGEASTAAARSYYAANKASTLRRYVRRHCFE